MNTRTRMRRRAQSAIAGLGAMVAVFLMPGQAHAALVSWDLEGTGSGVVGAHAWGSLSLGSDGRYYLTANIKDTAADGHGARLEVMAYYNDGWDSRYENLNATGNQATNSYTWNFASDMDYVDARECLTEQGEEYRCASKWYVIYRAHP
ncbi:hypothetical protein ABZ027_18705 [Streptomyces sp. NPDC006332]|uniref:hypothetical protein n=1 Tax=Streptomyces sp. NPDC006332 TaxID=3155456 RepID=UPI0033BC336E